MLGMSAHIPCPWARVAAPYHRSCTEWEDAMLIAEVTTYGGNYTSDQLVR
jgi:hypothetical protein